MQAWLATALDAARFFEMLRVGGPLLKPETLTRMTTDRISSLESPVLGEGIGYGYGVSIVRDPARARTVVSAGTFRWVGVYGHSWFVDRSQRLTAIALTNTAFEGMSGRFPTAIVEAIYGS